MGLSLPAYIKELHERSDLIWPQPPAAAPMKVTPSLKPLPGIKAVSWSVYGTLLSIDEGRLMHSHPQEIRMQIALEKTIKEFNMWYSMTRKKGQPWEGLLIQYQRIREELEMRSSKRKGDYPELDSTLIWQKIVERLQQKEYTYDVGKYGEIEELAAKIAYFFHASLQGVKAADGAREALAQMTTVGIRQAIVADGQIFTIPQLLHAFDQQAGTTLLPDVLSASLTSISYQVKLRKPSPTFYETAVKTFADSGIRPAEVLHVSHNLRDDLAEAKKYGFRTALFAADKKTCHVSGADVRDPDLKPDRLISEISQVREIVMA